jgi:cyclic pyranopterin phosphate synthase
MQDEEILTLFRLFTDLGFKKFRLTGGEPTVRANVVDLVREMSAVPGVDEISMTTNGVLLGELAEPLAKAGLKRVNISIDTLDAQRFKKITRWGSLDSVWTGIEAAEAAGLTPIKLNAVVVRNFNDGGDAVEMAGLTLDHEWQIRYIEMMPFGDVADFQTAGVVTEAELRATIESEFGPLELLDEGRLDGEARLFKIPGAKGNLGFISSVTAPFCAACNRARLTSDGKIRLCLLREKEVDLLTPLRQGASVEDLKAIIRGGVWEKPWGHGLSQNVIPLNRVMSEIGG